MEIYNTRQGNIFARRKIFQWVWLFFAGVMDSSRRRIRHPNVKADLFAYLLVLYLYLFIAVYGFLTAIKRMGITPSPLGFLDNPGTNYFQAFRVIWGAFQLSRWKPLIIKQHNLYCTAGTVSLLKQHVRCHKHLTIFHGWIFYTVLLLTHTYLYLSFMNEFVEVNY